MAFCAHCGNAVPDGAGTCPNCGQPQVRAATTTTIPPATRTDGYAIASLTCSVGGFFGLFLIGHILGVVFGKMALDRMRRDPTLGGDTLARAGIIIGWVGIGLAVAFLLIVVVIFIIAGLSFGVSR